MHTLFDRHGKVFLLLYLVVAAAQPGIVRDANEYPPEILDCLRSENVSLGVILSEDWYTTAR